MKLHSRKENNYFRLTTIKIDKDILSCSYDGIISIMNLRIVTNSMNCLFQISMSRRLKSWLGYLGDVGNKLSGIFSESCTTGK